MARVSKLKGRRSIVMGNSRRISKVMRMEVRRIFLEMRGKMMR